MKISLLITFLIASIGSIQPSQKEESELLQDTVKTILEPRNLPEFEEALKDLKRFYEHSYSKMFNQLSESQLIEIDKALAEAIKYYESQESGPVGTFLSNTAGIVSLGSAVCLILNILETCGNGKGFEQQTIGQRHRTTVKLPTKEIGLKTLGLVISLYLGHRLFGNFDVVSIERKSLVRTLTDIRDDIAHKLFTVK